MHDTTTQTLVTRKSILSGAMLWAPVYSGACKYRLPVNCVQCNSEANWSRWYGNSNIYTTTWEISALWLV